MVAQAIFAQKQFKLVHSPLPFKYRKAGNPSGATPDFNQTSEGVYVDAAEVISQGATALTTENREYFVDPNIWEVQDRLIDDASTPTSASLPAVTSASPISSPTCASDKGANQLSFAQSDAAQRISEFCSDRTNWDTKIVPSISMGTVRPPLGQRKL